MASNEQIATAAAKYIHSIPKTQASLRLPDLAQVLTDRLGERVSVPQIMDAREQLQQQGITLVNYSAEDLPLAEPTDRRTRSQNKTSSEWSIDLGQRVQQHKQKR